MLILAIESSCDDTAAAVLEPECRVLSSIISSQNEIHARFGGIVPELASRRHIEMIRPVVDEALSQAGAGLNDIDLIAATRGPGLVGSLLVGFTFAKALALVRGLPCVGVDHMAGHLLSCLLEDNQPDFPYTALIVSGGNTSLFAVDDPVTFTRLGRTRDDAAGEAFDKVAKLLGLDYPGGPVISRLAAEGNPTAIAFPRARLGEESLDFSFSGLKTSVASHVASQRRNQQPLAVAISALRFRRPWSMFWPTKPWLRLNRPATGAWSSAAGWRPTPGCGLFSPSVAPNRGWNCSCLRRCSAPTMPP